jgi:hypothetical protein
MIDHHRRQIAYVKLGIDGHFDQMNGRRGNESKSYAIRLWHARGKAELA